jgi:DNA polymerase-3 subunit beta
LGSSETGIDVETEGEEVEMAFNSRYLLEYLGVVRANKVIIESEGSLKTGVFREEGEEWVHIIMPVRVQS